MLRSLPVVLLVLPLFGCGASGGAPATSGSASTGPGEGTGEHPASAPAHELGANEKVLAFEGYDGPPGKLDPLPAEAWTVAPVHSEAGCTYQIPVLNRQRVLGTKGGLVVFSMTKEPDCHFAVPPALVIPTETGPIAKGDAVLVNEEGGAAYGRVEATEGSQVRVLMADAGLTIDGKIREVKADRADVLHVKDGFSFGSRVAVPNGNGFLMETVFAATDKTVFVVAPFETKRDRAGVEALAFAAPLPDGAAVSAKRADQDGVATGKVVRSHAAMVYEVQGPNGKPWPVVFPDLGLKR